MLSSANGSRSPLIAALAGLALVAALALAAPAISGTTLPKLAKQVKKLKKQVKAIDQEQGPQGAPGARGATGAAGQDGEPGPVAVHYQVSNLTTIPANSEVPGLRSNCPSGMVPIGGGSQREPGSLAPPKRNEGEIHSGPVDRPAGDADNVPDAWSVDYANNTGDSYNVQIFAICVDPTSTSMATG
jgi:hypothetical protein